MLCHFEQLITTIAAFSPIFWCFCGALIFIFQKEKCSRPVDRFASDFELWEKFHHFFRSTVKPSLTADKVCMRVCVSENVCVCTRRAEHQCYGCRQHITVEEMLSLCNFLFCVALHGKYQQSSELRIFPRMFQHCSLPLEAWIIYLRERGGEIGWKDNQNGGMG